METPGEHVDAGVLAELHQVMGDEFPSLLETFARDSEMRIDLIRQAVDSGDSDAMCRTAHSFKGSAGNMGARRLTRLCRALEELGRSGGMSGGHELLGEIEVEYRQVFSILSAPQG